MTKTSIHGTGAVLPKLVVDFRTSVADVTGALDQKLSIQQMLGFPGETWEWLPRNVLQFLGRNEDDGLLNFVCTSSRGFKPKDRMLFSESKEVDHTSVSRMLAARISKWLKWLVLPELDILVDAPHLVSRFPSLLQGDHSRVETWNATSVRHEEKVSNLDTDVLEGCRLKQSHWLSRPVWFWRDVMECEAIPDVRTPWNIESPPWVFCEDTSSFQPEEKCRTFKAETISPFATRYVKKINGVDYLPPQRFAL